LELYEIDSLTGKAKADDNPLIFVKSEEESEFIDDNKVVLSGSGSTNNERNYTSERKSKTQTKQDTHTVTSGERNALKAAKSYLDVMAFSYSGLIEQLEYEGYSSSEAEYAADNCGADWNEQAVKKAEEYLENMSFSKSSLIEQLEYEGFTSSQAKYGVNKAY
jgi:DNA-directed RNA polymerase specialized sigma54-like protein